MRVLLVVNATASSVTARVRVVIRKALAADHDLEVVETSRRGHASRLARAAARDGVDVVAVLGGDGTLNEAADGLMGTATALAPLPGGSTNVYARTLGILDDPIDATAQLLASLERRSFRRIGLGLVNGRCFLFHCGVGFDAAVVEQVERRSAFKRYAAHPLFVVAAFDTWLRRYDHSRGRFAVETATGETIEGGVFAIASKTSPYTYLGHRPLVVAPQAGLDSALSLTVVKTRHALPMLTLAATAFLSSRRFQRRRDVAQRDGLSGFTIRAVDAEAPLPFQVDGEFLGEDAALEFTYEPDRLTIVVP